MDEITGSTMNVLDNVEIIENPNDGIEVQDLVNEDDMRIEGEVENDASLEEEVTEVE